MTDIERLREQYEDSAVAVAVTLWDAVEHDPGLLDRHPTVTGALRLYIEAREAYLGGQQ